MMAALLANPSILDLFRRPSLWRDALAALQAALVLLMPSYARGGPDEVALPRGAAFSPAYDAQGKLLWEEHGNGLGTVNRYHPTRGFLESSLTWRASTQTPVQQMDMRVNDIGNVEWRRHIRYDAPASQQVRSESFAFDDLNRLTASYVPNQSAQSFAYHANGNIASKTGVGDYTYGQGAGPHAVTGVTLGGSSRRYTYDARGRMAEEYLTPAGGSEVLLRQVAHTSFDQPQFIQHWGAAALSSDLAALDDGQTPWDSICTLRFYFGPGLQRMIQTKVKGRLFTKTLSLGGYEIRETRLNGFSEAHTLVEKEERSHFGNGARVKRWTATSPTIPLTVFEYSLSDHLGSDSATYDGGGELQMQRGHLKPGEAQKSERQSYDAWGARRDAETWVPAAGQLGDGVANSGEREGSNLARGFTGHEMLDDVGLIHMNGRLYDPALGRMCAADPYVQEPELVQNYNRYSYVLNNPLSLVDPSGHFFAAIIGFFLGAAKFLAGAAKAAAAIAAMAAVKAAQFVVGVLGFKGTAASLGNMGSTLWAAAKAGVGTLKATAGALGAWSQAHPILAGAVFSGGYNAIQTAVNGGGLTDVLKSAAIGAVTGAIGAAVGVGVLHGMGKAANTFAGKAVHALAHGVAGGAMSEALGGSFKDGFIGGMIGVGVSTVFGHAFAGVSKDIGVLGRTAVAGVSGGIGAALTGGKFSDGAFSAAFFHLFNAELPEPEMLPTVYVIADAPDPNETAMGRVSSALAIVSMIPGPIGTVAGVLETGVALFTGDLPGVGWGLVGAAAAFVGAGAAVKGYRALRASRLAANKLPIPGVCFVVGTEIETEAGGRDIDSLRVGDRVLTTDGDSSTEVDPATWRRVTLRMPNPECPSDVLDLELLRSADWMATTGCQPGARMWFELDEMGLRGWAEVQSVGECPTIQPGRGRLVLATVTHENTFVMEVRLEGHAEPLRPTDRHRLFSVTRQDWVPTASLQPGEELRTASGTARISSVQLRPGTHRVFNIEVETEHSYFAGKAKVLSHNANPCAAKLPRFDGPKPTYHVNPAHVPGQGLMPGKTPLPGDAASVYRSAVPNDPVNPTAWFGRNADGQIYRFSPSNDGTMHFSGIDGVGDGVRNLTNYARGRLNGL